MTLVKSCSNVESVTFDFCKHISGKTLFYCTFTWQDSPTLHWFDIYENGRDADYCDWSVKPSGPCR
uniref:S-protein homolog n=1 Tax=Populus trichocarpa TaxID=3694 RepID=A0A2K1ZVB4_POPTR